MARYTGQPVYLEIAAELRRKILDRSLPPESKLPSVAELVEQYETSATPVRQALGILRSEGLIYGHQGRGSFVRPFIEERRIASDRYRRALLKAQSGTHATAFTEDQQIAWSEYRLDKEFHQVPAPDDVASLLDLDPGTIVLARHFVFFSGDQPQQTSVSYYPLHLVEGTPVADPANEPWPGGNIAQLASLGITVASVEEAIRSRMPFPEETTTLNIPTGVPVLTVTRRMIATDNQAVEAANIVVPADRAVLDYTIAVSTEKTDA